MADYINCRNCKKEISKNSKVCPYCGDKAALKISLKTWFFLFFFLVVIYNIAKIDTVFAGSLSASARKQIAKPLVTVQNSAWLRSGLTSVKNADLNIKNASQYTIKDIVIMCGYHDTSGTNIFSNTKTITDLIKPNTSKILKNVEMGISSSQAGTNGCIVSDFELMNNL